MDSCVLCRGPSEGKYTIHRDGFGEGPDVPLCVACAEDENITCEMIWAYLKLEPRREEEEDGGI